MNSELFRIFVECRYCSWIVTGLQKLFLELFKTS